MRIPAPPEGPSGITYSPPQALDQAGVLTWNELADGAPRGHADITGYEVQYRVDDREQWLPVDPAHTGTERLYADSQVWKQGTSLQFRVRAKNIATENLHDTFGTFGVGSTRRTGSPPVVGELTLDPAQLPEGAAGFFPLTDIRLRWTAATGAVDGHLIYRRELGDPRADFEVVVSNLTAGATEHQIPLPDGPGYEYAVQAYSLLGGGPLSRASFRRIAPPPDASSPLPAPVKLRGVAGGDASISGPLELVTGHVTEFTIAVTGSSGGHRYGGDDRGIAFDAGRGQRARWVDADNRAACVDVVLCLFRFSGPAFRYYPSDGRRSRWLVVWKGTDSTTGFASGDTLRVYVPNTGATASAVTYGFARMPTGATTPIWLAHGTAGTGAGIITHRSLEILPPLPVATSFNAQATTDGGVRLAWIPPTENFLGQLVQRKLSSADETGWMPVCCNLPPATRWIVDSPTSEPGTTTSYDYRVGTYFTEGHVQWFGPTITVALTGSQVGTPTIDSQPRFADADQHTELSFTEGVPESKELPAATGGDGTLSYRISDLSNLNLQLVAGSNPPQLSGAALEGFRIGTLQVTDSDGDTDYLAFRVQVGTTLGAPQELAASGGTQRITLTWSPPAGLDHYAAEGYRVERSATGGANADWITVVPVTETVATRFEDSELGGGETWHYRVAAVNTAGVGEFATAHATTAPNTAPDPPTGLAATAGLQHVTLTWAAPAFNGGAEISGYVVEYSSNGAAGTWQALGGDTVATNYSHDGLWPSWGAHYRVRARNVIGLSGPSDATFATTLPDAPPQELRATAGVRHIILTWTVPPGAGTDLQYRIEHRIPPPEDDTAGNWEVLVAATERGVTRHTHMGLAPEQKVYYRVAAIHRGGIGAPAAPIHATALTGIRVPFAPTEFEATAQHKSIDLQWTAPAADVGEQISGYRIEWSATGRDNDWSEAEDDTGNRDAHYSHTGLSRNQRIFHRVAALNSAGRGDWSVVLENVVLDEQPGAPNMLDVAWQTVTETTDGKISEYETGFTMPDRSVGGPAAELLVQMGFSADRDTVPDQFETVLTVRSRWGLGETVAPYRFKLDPPAQRRDTRGFARIILRNAAGLGPPSNAQRFLWGFGVRQADIRRRPEVSSAPQNLVAEAGPGRLGLRWEPPDYSGGTTVDGYRIERWDDGLEMWTDAVANTESGITAHVFKEVPVNATLRYRVSAINAAGTSDPSPLVRVDTVPRGIPAPPNQLTATAAINAITLTWQAPTYDGGAAITDYRVEHSASGAPNTWRALPNEPAATTTRTHDRLTAGQRVHYRVFALNAIGESQPTATAVGQVPATLAEAPASLTATAGQSRVFLDWTSPTALGGGTVEGYRIERRASGAVSWDTVVSHTGTVRTRHVDAGRAAGAALDYRVSAITSAGAGAGAEVSATPAADRPEPPTNVVVTLGASGFDVDWDAPASAGMGATIAGYRIERSVDGEATWIIVNADTQSTDTMFADTAADTSSRPVYRVFAINNLTHMSIPAGFVQATGTSLPPTPINVQATGEWNQNTITWLAVPASHDPAPTGYRVVMAESADAAEWRVLGDVEATTNTFTHTEVGLRRTVHYRVATRSAVGASTFSAPRDASTLDPEIVFDINGAGGFDEDDILIMYYVLNFPELVGDGSAGSGIPSIREAMLSNLDGRTTYEDSIALQMLADARQLARDYADTAFDVNGDLLTDAEDALIMYYAYQLQLLLGDGNTGGTPALRHTFLSGLAATPNPTDEDLRDLLRRANLLNLE